MTEAPVKRKLIEVAMPIEAVNLAGRAEKAVPKKGHPATLHLWWSRKPLGIARAVLFASLVNDPCSEGDDGRLDPEASKERQRLLDLTARLAVWDAVTDVDLMAEAARAIEGSWPDGLPGVLDPFCGGGAIPLEATRLGLKTTAVDVNPVAALITRLLISVVPSQRGTGPVHPRLGHSVAFRPASGLALDVQAYGEDLEERVRVVLSGRFDDIVSRHSPSGMTTAVSYLWTRMVACPNPACGRDTVMLSTWWLSKKPTNRWHVRPVLTGDRVEFEVNEGDPPATLIDPKVGRGANYRCVWCEETIGPDYTKSEALARRLGCRLVAVQAFKSPTSGRKGRVWLDPTRELEDAGLRAYSADPAGLDVEIPVTSGNAHLYGITTFADLLSPRQQATMCAFSDELRCLRDQIERDAVTADLALADATGDSAALGPTAYADAVMTCLAIAVSRMANRVSRMTIHNRANGSVEQSFVQPAYGFYGEFPEANPFSGSTGSWRGSLDYVVPAVEALSTAAPPSTVMMASALDVVLPQDVVVSTDPPYYDMFDYADLSNFFYIWLRRILRETWPDLLATIRVSGDDQVDANASRTGGNRDEAHRRFEKLLSATFERLKQVQHPACPMTIYYGYQQSQSTRKDGSTAWEALLESLRHAGLAVVATWPLRTERPEGVKKASNSLASSILLVCRPHDDNGPVGDRSDLRRALARNLPDRLTDLRSTNIPAVDVGQAVVGLGMAIYSEFGRVLDSAGETLAVADVLDTIRQVFAETFEDAGSTVTAMSQWALDWLASFGYEPGPYGQAEQLTKTWNLTPRSLEDSGIIELGQGQVRLRRREELLGEVLDRKLGGWLALQFLAGALESDGEQAAAAVLHLLDTQVAGEALILAHRHYGVSEGRDDRKDAVAYNSLTISWPAISVAATAITSTQGELL